MGRRIKLFDVAKASNISVVMVSRVLNHLVLVYYAALQCVYRAMQDAGFNVVDLPLPREVPITPISQTAYQPGFFASELSAEKITNYDAPPSQLILDAELIVRESL